MNHSLPKIENYLRSGNIVRTGNSVNSNKTGNIQRKNSNRQTGQSVKQDAKPKFSGETQKFWPEIVNDLRSKGKMGLYTNLIGTVASEINEALT